MNWLITDKGDQDCRQLADGHYSRQTIGAPQFTRNGQNLVFVTPAFTAVWVTFRPTPGKAVRWDGLDAWECSLFRNTGPLLSSELIKEAVLLSLALWSLVPPDGLITAVDPNKVRSTNPGCCFKKAGWMPFGYDKSSRPRFKAPIPTEIPHWSAWDFKGERGGKLRRQLETEDS